MSPNVLNSPLFSQCRENVVENFGYKFMAMVSRMSTRVRSGPSLSPYVPDASTIRQQETSR